MRNLLRTLIATAALLVPAAPALAHSDKPGEGWFEIKCTVAVAGARIDPLVFPGTTDVSHVHQFVGNRSINENSTNDSLRANPATTCQDDTEERQHVPIAERDYGNAIWYPRFYDAGVPLTATRVTSGYGVGYVRDFAAIQPFVDNMNFIAGSSAGGPQEINGQSVYRFDCPSGFVNFGSATVAPLCAQPGLRVMIFAPDCWDGVRADAPNHKDHMAYSSRQTSSSLMRVCPPAYPVLVPAHRIMIELPTRGGPNLTVATGSGANATTTGGMNTLHYDYMSAVAREVDGSNSRTQRTIDCLNQNEYCGGTRAPVPGEGGGI